MTTITWCVNTRSESKQAHNYRRVMTGATPSPVSLTCLYNILL